MGFLSKLKSLFNKSIALLPHQRNDVLSFVRLKNGNAKVGMDIDVDEDYKLVFVYYNKVCDILGYGQYKFNADTVPKLFHFSKSYFKDNKIFGSKSIKTDAYFVCLKEFEHNVFRTRENIVAFKDDEKVKLKLEGNFSFKIEDVEQFMKCCCEDYAIITSKKILKEIQSTVGFEVAKSLQGKGFKFDDYFLNRSKIIESIEEGVNRHTNNFGMKEFKFTINRVIVPKKYFTPTEIEKPIEENQTNEDIVKMVEERLNSLQNDLVYTNVESNVETSKQVNAINQEESLKENNFEPSIISGTSGDNYTFSQKPSSFGEYVNNQAEPNIIQLGTVQNSQKHIEETDINDELVDSLIEKINKRKKQKRDKRITEILTRGEKAKVAVEQTLPTTKRCKSCNAEVDIKDNLCKNCGNPTDELIVCACCGAKNFKSAQECCVCKSKLN